MTDEIKNELLELAQNLPVDQLPALAGDLEQVRTVIYARLASPAAPREPERRLSATEAASRLGISKQLFYKNARENRYDFISLEGRRVLAIASGLEKYISRPRR